MSRALPLVTMLCCAAIGLTGASAVAQRTFDTDILAETFGFDASTKKAVELTALQQGCPARDCIPSIDAPKYVSADEATLADDDVVVTLALAGEYRAYPTRILDHHEIVNDTIAGVPLAITWCPLCGSAVGLHREVGEQITEFGVSGVLYNSDLVLYDRATETLWDQIGASGIVGPLTGEKLQLIPVSMSPWGRWRAAHPDTLVLSEDTGFEEDYSQDYYAEYRDSTRLFMPVSNSDERIHPKTVVYGFRFDSGPAAFDAALFEDNKTVQHRAGDEQLLLRMNADGSVRAYSQQDEVAYSPIRVFWFAWYTFNPETELLR